MAIKLKFLCTMVNLMRKLLLIGLLLSNNLQAETVYPAIEYDLPESKWGKAIWYVTDRCKDPMNLFAQCKSKRRIESENYQINFFKTHKKCSTYKYVKLNESCELKGKNDRHIKHKKTIS